MDACCRLTHYGFDMQDYKRRIIEDSNNASLPAAHRTNPQFGVIVKVSGGSTVAVHLTHKP
jgi:hypothetical protein